MNSWKQPIYYAGLIFVSILLWQLLDRGGALDGLKHEAMSWRYHVRGERESSAPIVYVDLDSETISSIGDKPWNRHLFGVLVGALLGPGEANVVGLDIIFSQFGASGLLDVEAARKGDDYFGSAIEFYSERTVLAAAYTGVYNVATEENADLMLLREGHDDPEFIPFPEAPSFPIIKFGVGRLGLANADEALNNGPVPYWVPAFMDIAGPRYSLHLLDGYRKRMADILNEPQLVFEEEIIKVVDSDGWEPFKVPKNSEQRLLSFGLELFLAAHGLTSEATKRDEESLKILKDGEVLRELPLAYGQSIEVNWFEGWDLNSETLHVSMQEVLKTANSLAVASQEGNAEEVKVLENWFSSRFKDKVIFVGPVDETLKDIAPTPYNRELVPKVSMHANLYRTIQDKAFIKRINEFEVLLCMIALTFVAVFVTLWGGSGRGITRFLSLLLPIAYVGLSFVLFSSANFVLPIIAPLGASLTASLCVVTLKLGSEEWQRRRIKTLFGSYLSPKLVDEMVGSNRDPELGGAEAEITALFSDVVGFSSIAEEMQADDLVALMNEYLGAMTEVIQEEGGTLDKYIGDAIVAMFGRPIPAEDHALRACRAAVRMQERHAELRNVWRESGRWPEAVKQMRTRVGLNTGVAAVGNMGSHVRFTYTMMGDSVNLAARCESGGKIYGVHNMVTSATLAAAHQKDPNILARKLDRIVVKGRIGAVDVFELFDSSCSQEDFEACRSVYESGLEAYFSGNWQEALESFEKSIPLEPFKEIFPTTPSRVLAARCRKFLDNGEPPAWDGAYRMLKK